MFTRSSNNENQRSKIAETSGKFFGKAGGTPFFQAKLTVNEPGDVYEQEADAVAERVLQTKEGEVSPNTRINLTPTPIKNVQREEHEENGEQPKTPQTTIPNWIGQGYFLRTGRLPFSLSTLPRPRLVPGLNQPLLAGFSPTSPLLVSPPPAWILSMKPWTQSLPTPDDGLDWAAVNHELATRGALHLRDGLHDSVIAQYQANFLFFKNIGFKEELAMKLANGTLASAVGKSIARDYPTQSEMFDSTLPKDGFKIPSLPIASGTFGGPPGNRGSFSLGGIKSWVFRKETPGTSSGITAPKIVEDTLANDSGHPMDIQTQAFMEDRFGQDFGQVRIHTGEKAAESASAIQAKAYTSGKDIVFGRGEYRPDSREGKRLLAHELAHVGQQNTLAQMSLISRKATFVKGTEKNTINPAEQLFKNATFMGQTKVVYNKKTKWDSNPINGPQISFDAAKNSCSIKEPINTVSYQIHLPITGDWIYVVDKDWVISRIKDSESKEKMKSRCSGSTMRLIVRPKPDKSKRIEEVKKHEQKHVNDIKDAFMALFYPWDQKLVSLTGSLSGQDEKQCTQSLYQKVITEDKLYKDMEFIIKSKEQTYHQTAVGKPVTPTFKELDCDGLIYEF